MPQLKTRNISVSAISPRSWSQPKMGGRGQAPRSMRAHTVCGSTRGTLPSKPPPVTCTMPLIEKSRIRFRTGFT